jgi:hypothetical protein
MSQDMNDQLALICGPSGTGKSASLQHIRNQEKWFYLNAEAGKRLPFRNQFRNFRIEDPYQVHEAFQHAIEHPGEVDGIVIDTSTFLMDMFETQYVLTATNTMEAWSKYNQFFKKLMQQYVVQFGKPVLILAHTLDVYDEKAMEYRTAVPIKGSLKNQGVEAYFSTVVETTKMALKDLENYQSDLLNITDDDRLVGFKYVFQTRLTKTTTGKRIRSPMGLFQPNETFMDNDAQKLLDHLHSFYH